MEGQSADFSPAPSRNVNQFYTNFFTNCATCSSFNNNLSGSTAPCDFKSPAWKRTVRNNEIMASFNTYNNDNDDLSPEPARYSGYETKNQVFDNCDTFDTLELDSYNAANHSVHPHVSVCETAEVEYENLGANISRVYKHSLDSSDQLIKNYGAMGYCESYEDGFECQLENIKQISEFDGIHQGLRIAAASDDENVDCIISENITRNKRCEDSFDENYADDMCDPEPEIWIPDSANEFGNAFDPLETSMSTQNDNNCREDVNPSRRSPSDNDESQSVDLSRECRKDDIESHNVDQSRRSPSDNDGSQSVDPSRQSPSDNDGSQSVDPSRQSPSDNDGSQSVDPSRHAPSNNDGSQSVDHSRQPRRDDDDTFPEKAFLESLISSLGKQQSFLQFL